MKIDNAKQYESAIHSLEEKIAVLSIRLMNEKKRSRSIWALVVAVGLGTFGIGHFIGRHEAKRSQSRSLAVLNGDK